MKQLRKRLTYANVMSSIAVFLVLGGATAFAVSKVPNKSVGTKQLKANAVTTAKLKKNAVTTAKLKNEAVTGAKINETTLGSVPSALNSTTTSVVKASKGTIAAGQQATVLQHGPISLYVKCEFPAAEPAVLSAHLYIASSTEGTTFASWEDDAKSIGPATPETDREATYYGWASSAGPFAAEPPAEGTVSAQAANGESFNAFVGLASEKDSNTCWYWASATIIS